MTKYLTIVLLIFSLNSVAQSYQQQIDAHRKTYMNDFLEDKNSPLKRHDLRYLRFYNADSTYRVEAKVEMILNASPFIIPAFSGNGSEYVPYARLKFNLKDKQLALTVYRNVALAGLPAFKDYLFLPFTDDTNGKETYGGGRYIDLRDGDLHNSKAMLDFNKAYNPYCAFSAGYACPKPPDENNLPLPIPAGEKKFAKAH
jgi:uncharacterized protein (DUF1684 family)